MKKKCLNCTHDFEPNNGKQKYCSDACKMAYKRAQDKLKDSLGNLKEKVTTGDKVGTKKYVAPKELTDRYPNGTPQPVIHNRAVYKEDVEAYDLANRLKEFCKLHKTNPDDLFSWLMDNYGKKPDSAIKGRKLDKDVIVVDHTKSNVVGKPYDPFNNPLFKSKMSNGRNDQKEK